MVKHHINGNRQDNREENLELSNKSDHTCKHQFAKGMKMVKLKCPSCGKIFERRIGSTHLVKDKNYTACSRSCTGKISGRNRKNTSEINKKIKENVIKVYRKYNKDTVSVA